MSQPDMELEAAKGELKLIVDEFNQKLDLWETSCPSGIGANFGYEYDHMGRKHLKILDVAIIPTKPDEARTAVCGVIIGSALASCEDPIVAAPELPASILREAQVTGAHVGDPEPFCTIR
jgi:hypothetical protein